MPRYIIERSAPGVSADGLPAAGKLAIEVAAQMPGVVRIKSYVSYADGDLYCEYEAPNPEAIREHARRAGFPCDRITEVSVEISPAMFQ